MVAEEGKPLPVLLTPFLAMDPSCPGVMPRGVVTVVLFAIGCWRWVCRHLGCWLLAMVGTVVRCGIS